MFAIPGLPEARTSMRAGMRGWLRSFMQPMLEPRMVMGLSLTILFFGMMARCAGIPERKLTPADLDPAHVWVGTEERIHRGWERTVKFYENLKFVYQIQSRVREWREQQDQEAAAPAESATPATDERRLPASNTPPERDSGKPGKGSGPRK